MTSPTPTQRALFAVAIALFGSLALAVGEPTGEHSENRASRPRSACMIDAAADALRAEEPRIKERRQRIEDELTLLDRAALGDGDWAKNFAGTYYTGDGLGMNVSISVAPKAGIAFLNYGCLGLYGGDHGEIVETLPDGLRLKLTFGTKGGSFLSERVYFVKWGDERFLVPDHLMTELINNFNQGGFRRISMFGIPRMIREGGGRLMVDAPHGRPELPPAFAKQLLDAPAKLTVLSVSPPTTTKPNDVLSVTCADIEFSGGSEAGVFVGMEFRYPRGDVLLQGTVRITRVMPMTSTGRYAFYATAGEQARLPPVGAVISTSDDDDLQPPPPAPAQPEPPPPSPR